MSADERDEWAEMSGASNEAGEAQADIWDERMGEDGNDFHRQLVRPTVERLLALQAGEAVLDLGCGNGVFSRHLCRLGAVVTAVDVSEEMIRRARGRGHEGPGRVTYGTLDATSQEALDSFGMDRFDAVVCNMVLMDLARIQPLAEVLPRILRGQGRFVFCVTHPCFNNDIGTSRLLEESHGESGRQRGYAIKVSRYITPTSFRSRGICGRDEQLSFHRPLSGLLAPFFAAGLVLDAVEEPVFEPQEERVLGQSQFREIPWALAGRMRTAG